MWVFSSIAGYFLPYLFDINRSGYHIHIMHQQSLHDWIADDQIRYRMKMNSVKTFENEGKTVVEIYAITSVNIDEIRHLT